MAGMSELIEDRYESILRDVDNQLHAQIAKWGVQDHPSGTREWDDYAELVTMAQDACEEARVEDRLTWAHILDEEIAEALAEPEGSEALRTELIQVAAVAIAWVENLDRGNNA